MFLRRVKQMLFPRPEYIGIGLDHELRFVERSSGVVHVGAHTGEEAWIYNAFRVPVIWVEANPELIPVLSNEIQKFSGQHALQALLTERDGEEVEFRITNNGGASSSVLQLGEHSKMYPDVNETSTVRLKSTTLERVLEKFDGHGRFDALVLDVQGAELLVLKGAGPRITQFKFIFAECSDFEIYKDCCTVESLSAWLKDFGYSELKRYVHHTAHGVGTVFDILFVRD
ncbi:MAG: hypothetical protein RLZZ536_1905 [Planctomycetota bacterium]|jgi:FkbM family methyltransferase